MTKPAKFDISGAKKELKALRELEQYQRDHATNILRPDQIHGRDWRSAKVLMTTLGMVEGGKPRRITKQDLIAFNKNIARLESRVERGITANEIINLSTEEDKKRAKEQIHFAVPVSMKYGSIMFLTNSGPESKVLRHSVQIILDDYSKGISKGTPLQAAKEASKGNLLIECDCEHFRYVYRYIATIMRSNAGRPEHGFPKLKNPYLEGIACKHVLRVVTELNSSIFIWRKIATMIESDRANNASKELKRRQKTITLTQKEATELSAKQKNNIREIKAVARKAPPPTRPKRASTKPISNVAELMAVTGLTMEQITAMIAAQKG